MARASGVGAEIDAAAVPLLPGARDAVAATSTRMCPPTSLLHDAQTSGGLLLGLPSHVDAAAVVAELKARNLPAARIGQVTDGNAGHVRVRQ